MVEGNAVELLENGAFFDALVQKIAAVQCSLHFETFLWKEDRLSARLAAALAERARAGVQVRVLLDARGCSKAGQDAERIMAEAGWCATTRRGCATWACLTGATTARCAWPTDAWRSWAGIASWTSGSTKA
ncbi:phospholipase D-like domain-containing protein [Azohydromonas australica]|uniref:phospholipase D-like domain-containing protein n=1 Tax=Azohydromonas australica TaxID=364039 RepID=UPI00040BD57E|nr:hypothetical protein [Azohydromonas australica]